MKPGDRIRLDAMPDDPSPIEAGAEGVIEDISRIPGEGRTQVSVAWDNGRSLMLCVPPDRFTVIGREEAS